MKKIVLLLSIILCGISQLDAQLAVKVNLYGGTNPYSNTEWNNWNVPVSTTTPIGSGALNYNNGSASTIVATLSRSNGINDNGASYGGTMAPAEVLRYDSYSSIARTLTLSGLSLTKSYDLELYGSRNNPDQSTIYSVNGNSTTVGTYNNLTNKAQFTGITADGQGQIVVNLSNVNMYNYLNGFILTEINNQSPTASAGQNQTITLPVSSVTLTGSGSDPDGTIAAYAWTQVSGPQQATINTPSASSTSVSGLVEGTFTFQLTVTDNLGSTASAQASVTVKPAITAWQLGGNTGTSSQTQFIGTLDNQDLVFKTNSHSWAKLTKEGTLETNKIKVTQDGWADYVFDSAYQLRPISEVQQYIKTHKHLPDVPSEREVQTGGLNLGDNQAILLRKIEELTLYIIKQNEELKKQGTEIEALKKEVLDRKANKN